MTKPISGWNVLTICTAPSKKAACMNRSHEYAEILLQKAWEDIYKTINIRFFFLEIPYFFFEKAGPDALIALRSFLVLFSLSLVILVGFALNRGERRWIHFVFTVFFFLMTLRSRRHSPFFALTSGMANLWNYGLVFDSIKDRLKELLAFSVSLAHHSGRGISHALLREI